MRIKKFLNFFFDFDAIIIIIIITILEGGVDLYAKKIYI